MNTSLKSGLDGLMAATSIAVIGASEDPRRIGGRPVAYMRERGYSGQLFPVNPTRKTVQGLPSYESVEALPCTPDAAIVAVPAPQVHAAVHALGRRGVAAAIVFSAGFAEVGEAGLRAQEAVVASAREYGMRILGPNTLGLYNERAGYYPTFSSSFESGWPLPGGIGIASQSGAFAAHIFTAARERRIGVPICITTGNEGDISLGEAMQWLVQDPETHVVAVYAEGIRDANSFIAALEAAHAARKPVILMKTGRSAIGTAAAQSHTSAIAGNDAAFDAVLSEFAVVRARSAEDFLDLAHLATRRVYPVGNTLGVLSISGGAAVLISDSCEELRLPLPEMPAAAQATLKELMPIASVRNPVDCTAQVFNNLPVIGRFADTIVGEGDYRSMLYFFTMAGGTPSIAPGLRQQLAETQARYADRLHVASILGSAECVDAYEAAGLTVFSDPTRAVHAIEGMGRLGDAFARPLSRPVIDTTEAAIPADTAHEAAAKVWLARLGIPVVEEAVANSAAKAAELADRIGYPVVLKIVSPDIAHKSEIGGVLLDVQDREAVANGYELLLRRAAEAAPIARIEGVLVARQIRGGVECLMGIQRDPVFGPFVVFGLGGIFVEVLRDVVMHRCPIDEPTAKRMIMSIRGAALLRGARGTPPADVSALARTLARLSTIAVEAGPRLQSIDLNPVLALPEGQGCFAVDALVHFDEGAQT